MLQEETILNYYISSDVIFPITGYYSYHRHEDGEEHEECFVPKQANRLLFKKGEIAPKLGSCDHVVVWKLIKKY